MPFAIIKKSFQTQSAISFTISKANKYFLHFYYQFAEQLSSTTNFYITTNHFILYWIIALNTTRLYKRHHFLFACLKMVQQIFLLSLAVFCLVVSSASAKPNFDQQQINSTEKEKLFPIENANADEEVLTSNNSSQTFEPALNRQPRATALFRCTRNSDCQRVAGYNSQCYQNRCICQMGYISLNSRCLQILCTKNSDCAHYFAYTRCNSFSNRCVCTGGTRLNVYSQTCLFSSGKKVKIFWWNRFVILFLLFD